MLSVEDSHSLQESAKRCKDAKERERLRALYAISVGYPIPTVAEIFSVDEGTIYRWIERWQEEKRLSDKPKRGRPGSLSEEEKQMIRDLVTEGNPKKHGINASIWNTKELREYFYKKGKNVSQETIRRCLKEMGARYVKVDLENVKDDIKMKEEFVKKFVDVMKYNPSLIMLFEDELLADSSPKRSCTWTFEKRLAARPYEKKKKPGRLRTTSAFEETDELLGDKKELTYVKLSKKDEEETSEKGDS